MQSHTIDIKTLRSSASTTDVDKLSTTIVVEGLNLFYGGANQALFDVSLDIPEKCVTAFIGASGCGKSSLLRLSLIHI